MRVMKSFNQQNTAVQKQKVVENVDYDYENYNLILQKDSLFSFNSLYDKGYDQFINDSGFIYIYNLVSDEYQVLFDVMSVKYIFGHKLVGYDEYPDITQIAETENFVICENKNCLPMGFTYDSMMSYDKFISIEDNAVRLKTYLKALIVEDTDSFSDILKDVSDEAGNDISKEEYNFLIADRKENACYYCEKKSDGLIAKINLDRENVVFFSASYNDNWTAYVDGKETEVYNVNTGCVGVRVPAGNHEIVLKYKVKGFAEGICISATAAVIYVIYAIVDRKKWENIID